MQTDAMTLAGQDTAEDPAAPRAPAPAKLGHWFAQGFRVAFLMRPRLGGEKPDGWLVAAMVALVALAHLGLARLEIAGPAGFNQQVWLASWWQEAWMVLCAWTLAATMPAGHAVPSLAIPRWLLIWLAAQLPIAALNPLIARFNLSSVLADRWVLAWGLYLLLWAWSLAACFVSARTFLPRGRAAALALSMLAAGLASEAVLGGRVWYPLQPQEPGAGQPRLHLSQQAFETQQAVWQRSVDKLAPQRPGVTDVYGIVFAPYADEDVFLRESTMVLDVLTQRFDAGGRVLHLVNHASTAETHPWATPENLRRAVAAVASRMDRERDVLVVYMTSHGASNFQLAARHWPLEVDAVAPQMLRQALDEAGIRHRVIAVSACYSGGWVEPLADEHSLVMTAADATHTSYGCGRLSELTFFGRAVWNEQLRRTRSFEQAFAEAVPLIRKREQEAGKQDGFSNPQIRIGGAIRPVLEALRQRLDKAAP